MIRFLLKINVFWMIVDTMFEIKYKAKIDFVVLTLYSIVFRLRGI